MIRPARAEDVPAVAAIEAAWPTAPGWTAAQFGAELGRGDRLFLVAEADGGIDAYAAAWLVGGEAQLFTISVRPALARRGQGTALLAALMAAAKAAGCAKLTLEVSEHNAAARALYARAGARVVGRRPKFYNDGADALLLDIPL